MGNVKKIYLCGPINGCTDEECNNWRDLVRQQLPEYEHINPMRRDYRGVELECVNEIVELDKLDVRACDIVIASCPKPSVGTSMEVLYAWSIGKPVMSVVPDGAPVSPWLKYHSTKIVSTFSEATDWIKRI